MDIKYILIVGLGSGLGGILRYIIGRTIACTAGFPWATLAVNLIGCFTIGLLAALAEYKCNIPDSVRLLLTVGLCGGFTTFSTFGLESFSMISTHHYATALFYMAASLIGGLALIFAGYCLARIL